MPVFTFGNIAVTSIDATEGGALTDISATVTNVHFTAERDTQDFKGQGGAAVIKLVGPVASSYTVEMGFDPTTAAMFQTAMAAATPVTRSFTHGPAGLVAGQPKQTSEVYVASFETEADSENPTTMTAELVVSGAVTYGTY
jgi:hypothetical protein